jgi:wyosine [tRNA(Phe)-imidazoG37] synthetase (radical SAM superfamily)
VTLLRVIQPEVARVAPRFATTAGDVSYGPGFYGEEHDGSDAFRWMAQGASLTFAPDPEPRFLEFRTYSEFYDLSQHLEVSADDATLDHSPLPRGWAPWSIAVPPSAAGVRLGADRLFPREYYPADTRALALRVRDVRLHKDAERHAAVRRQQENAILNARELLAGRTSLESSPPSLGIDLHGACNVKPPCVYCEWDYSKNLEEDHVDTPFTRETLREWGPFFDNAVNLVNCSIGEPFMMKNIDDLLDTFGNTGKVLEMTTNGQILTERNIQKLLGRPIDLYVSLDAATPLTYSRLRSDTFEKILGNLRRLIDAKGGPGRLPRVHLVFMPMRCNVHELEAFIHLAADLRADRLVLRPLNYSPSSELSAERAGYVFEYQKELLPFDELVQVSGRAARLARDLGVPLADQMDFGGAMRGLFVEAFDAAATQEARPAPLASAAAATPDVPAVVGPPADAAAHAEPAVPAAPVATGPLPSLGDERLPICAEPWKSLYILRRGVMPCCYGGAPLAPMESYRETWNSPEVQAIRSELLNGRFHDYCLRSSACPIVRKSDHAGTLPFRQQALLRARDAFSRANRRLGGVPLLVWIPIRRTASAVRLAVTDPRRFAQRLRELGHTSSPRPGA